MIKLAWSVKDAALNSKGMRLGILEGYAWKVTPATIFM